MVLGFGRKSLEGLGCYGKLPHHGDYVSHGNDGAAARILTGWLDEGYRLTGGQDDPAAAETWFLIHCRKKSALCGALCPSHDSSGSRRFPFATFTEASVKPLAVLQSIAPLAFAPAWRAMSEALPGLRGAETLDDVLGRLSSTALPTPPERENLAERFSTAIAGVPATLETVRALCDVNRLAGALAPGKKGSAPAFAIGLPLGSGLEPEMEATFWLEALSRRLDAASLASESSVFVRPPQGEDAGHVFVIHRDLRADDLGFILSPSEGYPYGNLLGVGDDEDAALAEYRGLIRDRFGDSPSLGDVLALG